MLRFPLNVAQKWVRQLYGRDVFIFLPQRGFVKQVLLAIEKIVVQHG